MHSLRAVRCATLTLVALCLAAASAAAQTLTVAAASDLQSALPEIVSLFEKTSGLKVTLTFGSSGNFYAQIQNGAPFDVFLSADVAYPEQLEQTGFAERGSVYEYGVGRIVLWTRSDSGIDIRKGLAVLSDPAVRRIAIANPEHAPYGRAAIAAIRHEQLYERVRGKFVLGESISQAAQFAQSGSADVGVLALSVALSPTLKSSGAYFEIPESWHPPIEQAAVVLSSSKQKALARRFIDHLKSPDSVRTLQSYGFAVPHAPVR